MLRMLLIRWLICWAIVLPSTGLAQQFIRGQVLDARGDQPLVGAHVVAGEVVAYTDAQGCFDMRVLARKAFIRVSHVGFEELRRTVVASGPERERTVLRLKPKAVELPTMEVRVSRPEVVFERKDLHVGDYVVNSEGLWVLAYHKRQLGLRQGMAGQTIWHGPRLHLLDTGFVELASGSIPSTACAIVRDHAGRPVVKAEDSAWMIERHGQDMSIGRIDAYTYQHAVLPWTDSLPGLLLGNTWTYEYPAFEHVAYHANTERQEVICQVVDPFWMSIFRGSYKYMSGRSKVLAMDLAMEHGTDPETIAGFMVGIDADLRYKPPYAPLFVVRDTLCVFDHHKERIRRFNRQLQPIDEIAITYQRDRDWDRNLVQDRATGAVYARYARGSHTWLQHVDPVTGTMGAITRLTHPWPTDIQVHDGHVYYVYRPYESLQKRTLYREPLR
ncbi:MAG: carboxypeptidase-like regulatory domain-containing protein [Flavobacteriales bacterium]|nr:carboxypeptidase-like regulatory domain-containing protein [Flavobacteriales bacterium]